MKSGSSGCLRSLALFGRPLGRCAPPAWFGGQSARRSAPAFTLTELLVVMAVIAILASLILPGLSSAKSQAKSTYCLNNLKQLQLAFFNYAHNNGDALVPNYSRSSNLIQQAVAPSWVLGNAKHDNSTINLEAGLLFREIGDDAVYHCPSDNSKGPLPSGSRTRSYALSGWASASDVEGKGEKFDPWMTRLSELTTRSSAEVFAFIDEHADSIDDGVFAVNDRSKVLEWKDLPAGRHNQGYNLSFLDEHVEHWRWQAPKVFRNYDQRPYNDLDKEDLFKIRNHLSDEK